MIRHIIRVLWCHVTHGHIYGAWDCHQLSRGRRMETRACLRCGWIATRRD